jgi:hypothetical protein
MFVCSDIETMEIEAAISFVSREILSGYPFDACCETAWSASIEDGDAIRETSAGSIKFIDAEEISLVYQYG